MDLKVETKNTTNFKLLNHKILILIPLLFLVAVTMGITGFSAGANSSVIYVNGTGGSDSNSGTSWDQAKLTIGNATGTVNAGGSVKIADGTYKGAKNRGITLKKSMTIVGQTQKGTIIDAQKQNRIFTIVKGVTVTLQKLTLTNGYVKGDGGAVLNSGTLVVKNTTFKGNTAQYPGKGNNVGNGGAIASSGKTTVTDSTFTGNAARLGIKTSHKPDNSAGGGAIVNNKGTLAVTRSTFKSNVADINGGAIVNNRGKQTVKDSIFTSNLAHGGGGAIVDGDGSTTVVGSTFNRNKASGDNGGAIVNGHGNFLVTASNFIRNVAFDGAGAIINGFGVLTVESSTFTKNTVSGKSNSNGGAIINGGRKVTVIGSTFTGNEARDGAGAILNGHGILEIFDSIFKSNIAHQNGGAILNGGGILRVYTSNFTLNRATDKGGAIFSTHGKSMEGVGETPGSFLVMGSDLTYNTASSGGAIYLAGGSGKANFNRIIQNVKKDIVSSSGRVDARYNWWGSNRDPSNRVSGNVIVRPWLILSITASPTTLAAGASSTVTVDLLHDSWGVLHSPSPWHVPDGIPVTFYPTNGVVDPVTAYLVNGQAQTIYTLTANGEGLVKAQVDVQVVEAVFNGKGNPSPNTVPMQDTGAPFLPLVTALIAVGGGLFLSRRK